MSFKYLREKLSHGRYVGLPPPPSLRTPPLNCDTKRDAAARRVSKPANGPINGGTNGGSILGAGRGGNVGGTPRHHRIPADGDSNTNPQTI